MFKQRIDLFNFLFTLSLLFNSTLIILSIGMLLNGYFLQGCLMITFFVYLRYFTLKYIYNEIEPFDLIFTDFNNDTKLKMLKTLTNELEIK
jgi:hypothetical protein